MVEVRSSTALRDGLFEICPPAIEQMLGSSVSQAKGHIAAAKTEAGLTVPSSVRVRSTCVGSVRIHRHMPVRRDFCRRSKLCRTCQGCCRMRPLKSVRCLDGRWSCRDFVMCAKSASPQSRCLRLPLLAGLSLIAVLVCGLAVGASRDEAGATKRSSPSAQVGIYFLASKNATVNNHLMKKLSPRVCFGPSVFKISSRPPGFFDESSARGHLQLRLTLVLPVCASVAILLLCVAATVELSTAGSIVGFCRAEGGVCSASPLSKSTRSTLADGKLNQQLSTSFGTALHEGGPDQQVLELTAQQLDGKLTTRRNGKA